MHTWKVCWTALSLLSGFGALAGCGGPPGASISETDQRTVESLNVLATFYGDYMNQHGGRPPKNEGDFRAFMKSQSNSMERRGVEDLEQFLMSPRDYQPYTIVSGKLVKVSDSPGVFWAAHEQTGVDGNRMAVRTYGGVDLLGPDEFGREFSAN